VRGLAKVSVKKDPDDKALARMERLVDRELEDGAWGLTTGLEYVPGTLAKEPELAAIARPVGQRDGVIMSHLRSEDDDRIDASLDELIAQGKAGGARVHVAHVKVVYGKGVQRAEALLDKLEAARKQGVSITADIYPYSASYTTISIVFPDFALPPNSYKRVKREKREELAKYLREKVKRRNGPEATLFGTGPWRGKTLAAAAKTAGKPFEELLMDDIGPAGASAAYFVMDEALQTRLLLDRWVMIGTDGSAGSRHPRGYGSFAKVIREQVVEKKALTLVEAVRKMSGLPAETLRLDRAKRGMLRAGWAADLLVFDPAAVKDRATFEEPHQLAEGMDWVLVNGVTSIQQGKRTKRHGGRIVLKRAP
jgi:N-acyl-D-amino-acid deacylase